MATGPAGQAPDGKTPNACLVGVGKEATQAASDAGGDGRRQQLQAAPVAVYSMQKLRAGRRTAFCLLKMRRRHRCSS